MKMEIWTIGHSTLAFEAFVARLSSFDIQLLVDIRRFPGSRRYPHFNQENLQPALEKLAIQYRHLEELGGRRKSRPDSKNTAWRNLSFRGYADYMETGAFREAAATLESWGKKWRLAYMCSEATWWRCHRALVSDYLKARGWHVCHIISEGKCSEHPYTAPAREKQGDLFLNS